MTKRLTEQEVAAYRRDGILFPIRVFPEHEMAGYRGRLAELEARDGGTISRPHNQKPHLLVPWLADLVRHPAILDAVEDVVGPDILCWGSGFFNKRGGDGTFVSWHQDATYWGLSESDVVTAWIAFSASTPANGCMRVIPGTQDADQLPHADTFATDNLLSRGQEIAVQVDEKAAVDVVLAPGEMSLHHVKIVHGSERNDSDGPRIGYAVRYIPTRIRQLSGIRDSASLVRGVDRFDNFDHEPTPKGDFHPEAVAYHTAMLERQVAILYAGADQRPAYGKVVGM
ncbi:chlorinating enzyme [Stella humosa]|uniref:Chlorinating enzyme n=1 Tax=Stella humosa TaxID=94 RepID=A0A3N1MF65_9PROT|nr:phytanoyl-CoA dioxygenase family protein [Stella humosa]ROQ01969.1 chlorinating enzyme [Stella humosa]BBK32358.1 syringomycin biosynthesis enzyme [Stella humosa]